jgi:hypothetical protein
MIVERLDRLHEGQERIVERQDTANGRVTTLERADIARAEREKMLDTAGSERNTRRREYTAAVIGAVSVAVLTQLSTILHAIGVG